jgi:UDP-N-acetylglucosamine 4,6-dehydratase
LEFEDHYVIQPAISFYANPDYAKNPVGERGKPVRAGFEYRSDNNPHFLTIDELCTLNGMTQG